MREIEDLAVRIGSLARLGRQRDFSLPRFRKALDSIARNGQRGEVLRQLLTDWTGLPFEADEAFARWTEIEQLIRAGAIHDGRASYPSQVDPSRPHDR